MARLYGASPLKGRAAQAPGGSSGGAGGQMSGGRIKPPDVQSAEVRMAMCFQLGRKRRQVRKSAFSAVHFRRRSVVLENAINVQI